MGSQQLERWWFYGTMRLAYVIKVPESWVQHWTKVAGEQTNSQVEMWALVSVRWCLRKLLHGRRFIEWIDNEAARVSAIKSNSPSVSMKVLARILADLEINWPSFSWKERVCSFSNPADLPSREKLEVAMRQYNLDNSGVLDASSPLEQLVLELHRSSYQVALQHLGT